MTKAALALPDPGVERELFDLVKRERLARDTGDLGTLAALYWADSVVHVTWFEGSIGEFIEVSRDQHQRGRGRGIHLINPVWSEVEGGRAVVESQGQIHIRPRVSDIECDVVSWCRFFSRLERRDGQWRLRTFDSIYGKDRIDPVLPDAALHLDAELLTAARPSYRHLTYLNRQAGYTVPEDLPGDDRPDLVEAFYAEPANGLNEVTNRPPSREKTACRAARFSEKKPGTQGEKEP
jgi:hypothetical protein